ncbi:MAG: hypothetical protein ACD_9C00228G0001 [uncultured bacterium]|nr:MAG: hypothetical protein ACD_9C00228G0001 [uncultured bacterium]
MNNQLDQVSKATSLSSTYANRSTWRAAIQLVPVVGSSIDTVLAGPGTKWQNERLNAFLKCLEERISRIEGFENLPNLEPGEPLFDFSVSVFTSVAKTRFEEKRKQFANIIAQKVVNAISWEEAELAARLVDDLTPKHVAVLLEIASAPQCSGYQNKKMVSIEPKNMELHQSHQPKDLSCIFHNMDCGQLKYVCSELSSKGLITNQAGLYFDSGSGEMFEISPFGEWFLLQIHE